MVSNAGYRYLDGAGCYFHKPGAKIDQNKQSTWQYLFLADIYGDKKRGWAHINDRVVELAEVGNGAPGEARQGQQYEMTYRAGDITVTLQQAVTGSGDTSSWAVQGQMRVDHGGQTSTVALQGNCGS